MPTLLRFITVNLAIGFLIGMVVGTCFVTIGQGSVALSQPLAVAMIIWAFGASFALGMLSTALAMLDG